MPNGRSASFNVSRHDFEQLLNTIPSATVVGRLQHSGPHGERSFRALNALEARQLFAEHLRDHFFVEEQDEKFYIIHFVDREEDITWIVVREGSPLFAELHRHCAMAVGRHQEKQESTDNKE